MLGSKEPKLCWHRQEELYNSWDAEVHLHRRLFLGTVTLLSKLSCFGKKVFVLMFRVQECVTRVQVVLVLSGEVMHTSLTLLSTLKSQS